MKLKIFKNIIGQITMKKHTHNLRRFYKFSILWGPIFTLFVFYSNAQTVSPCPTDNLSNYPGVWKHFSGYSAPGHIKAKPGSYDKTAADANLEKLLDLAKKAYPKPMGGNANFTKHLDFSNVDDYLPFGHKLYIGHPGFVCTVGDKVTETFETGVYLVFHINNYAPFVFPVNAPEVPGTEQLIGAIDESDIFYGINGKRVFLIHENFVSSNGWMDHYTEKIYRDEIPRQQWYIIRRENTPLFSYVTRKEYLKQFREEIKTYTDIYMRHVKDEYKKYPESFKQTYEGLDDYRKRVQKAIRLVDEYLLNKSEDELGKPLSELIHFEVLLYSEDTELKFREDRFHMAFFNEEYLDKKLPLHIPQFIIVELSAPAHDKSGSDFWKYNFRKK
jgi:hypothetical protein